MSQFLIYPNLYQYQSVNGLTFHPKASLTLAISLITTGFEQIFVCLLFEISWIRLLAESTQRLIGKSGSITIRDYSISGAFPECFDCLFGICIEDLR